MSFVPKPGGSLTWLFSRNYATDDDHTPSLMKLAKDRGLYKDEPELYEKVEDLNFYFCETTKHPSEGKLPIASSLNKGMVKRVMEVTQDVWLWFIKKNNNGIIPERGDEYFKDDF